MVWANRAVVVLLPSPWLDDVTATRRTGLSARNKRKLAKRLRSDSLIAKRSPPSRAASDWLTVNPSRPGKWGTTPSKGTVRPSLSSLGVWKT